MRWLLYLGFFQIMYVVGGFSETYTSFVIGIKDRGENLEKAIFTMDDFTPFFTYKKCWYADPIVFKHAGINYLFYENYPLETKKGIISCVQINQDLSLSNPIDVLEEDFHLSFPYVFADESKIYMTPETYNLMEINLYEAVSFPNKWVKSRTLVSGDKKFSDPIVFWHDGYYWIFAAVNLYEMVIYFSKSLEGEFQPHPINGTGLIGRNAGGLFMMNGSLVRPVMDCEKGYGHSMELKEIVKLSPLEFKERLIWRIEPDWLPGLEGTHALSVSDDIVVFDGYMDYSKLIEVFPKD